MRGILVSSQLPQIVELQKPCLYCKTLPLCVSIDSIRKREFTHLGSIWLFPRSLQLSFWLDSDDWKVVFCSLCMETQRKGFCWQVGWKQRLRERQRCETMGKEEEKKRRSRETEEERGRKQRGGRQRRGKRKRRREGKEREREKKGKWSGGGGAGRETEK